MNNTRFATIVHILTLLASDPEAWLSSDFLASSIMINPVVVRRELGVLRKADWVESRQGKEGGFRLKVSSEQILFKDIYLLIKNVNVLGKQNNNPNPRCPIGKEINNKLDVLAAETEQAVLRSLHGLNLKSFLQQFN